MSNEVWRYQPGSQQYFLSSRVFEVLLEGNRGGGKTDALIMSFVGECGKGYGHFWRGVLFRQTYPQLQDVIAKCFKLIPGAFPDAKFVGSPNPEWRFPGGETLLLRRAVREHDYYNYHGHEYPWQGWEELTTWAAPTLYRRIMSLCRCPNPAVPLMVRATTNPSGPGHNWVKKRFQLPCAPGRQINRLIRDDGSKFARCSIRSLLSENRVFLAANPHYRQVILAAAKDSAERAAWDEGRWDILAGGMFDDVWNPGVHIVPSVPFDLIPKRWKIDRSYDHGSAKPFSVGWWAESNGEPFEYDGVVYGAMRGDLYRVAEWYGAVNHENVGLRLTASKIAHGIVDRERDWGISGRVRRGPADTEIWNSSPGHPSVADEMAAVGVGWVKADKGPGSRKQGWQMIRQRLEHSHAPPGMVREGPGIYFCERCHDAIDKLPSLPRDEKDDPDDVDTEAEDHIGDEVRYRVRVKRARKTERW